MIDPSFLIVLADDAEVYDQGRGHHAAAERVAVTSYERDRWYPSEDNPQTYPALVATGSHGQVYVKERDVRYIVELESDEFRPLDLDGRLDT